MRADGTPVPGALVEASHCPWFDLGTFHYDGFGERIVVGETRTSTDGTFALRLSPGAVVTVSIRAQDLRRADLPHRRAGEYMRVVLDSGVQLHVSARTAEGAPEPGVALRVSRQYANDVEVTLDVTTDADGECDFVGLPPGASVFVSRAPGCLQLVTGTRVMLPLEGTATATVRTQSPTALRGRVVDVAGDIVEGAEAALRESFTDAAAVDHAGRFAIPTWDGKGTTDVYARAPGFIPVSMTAGEGDLILTLHASATATGRVVDVDLNPVAGALVSFVGLEGAEEGWHMSGGHAISGDDGSFEILGIDTVLQHFLTVAADGHGGTIAAITLDAPSHVHDLGDIVLSPAQSIVGTVIDTDDAPVRRAAVTLLPWASAATGRVSPPRGVAQREQATDDLGRFAFADVGPGDYIVFVRPTGHAAVTRNLTVSAGEDPEPLQFTIEGSPLTVRVVDVDARPLPGITVLVTSTGRSPILVRTAADGSVDVTRAGVECSVSAVPSENEDAVWLGSEARIVAFTERELTIVVAPGAIVRGQLIDFDRQPIAGAQLVLQQSGRDVGTTRTDGDGQFRGTVAIGVPTSVVFGGVVSGSGSPFDSDSGLRARADGVMPEADALLVATAAEGSHSPVVRARSPDGFRIEGAIILYSVAGSGAGGMLTTDANGNASLPARDDTRWSLSGVAFGEWSPPRSAEVGPDDDEVTLQWRASDLVSGRAILANGRPPERGEFRIGNASGWYVTGDLNSDGAFTAHVPRDDGPWTVRITGHHGSHACSAVIEDVRAASTDVWLTLTRD